MTGRSRIAGPVRYVVASAFMAMGLLLILSSQQSRAASASPSNCPDGFHWERMSGVGCVQTTLPPRAQYSYTSAAICSEPHIAQHAPGPNPYGSDPNTTYLVACLTAEEVAALSSPLPGQATQAPGDGGDGTMSDSDGNHGLGTGPLDKLAGGMLDDGMHAPDPRDADLGGVAATGVLLFSIGGAVIAAGAGGAPGMGSGTGSGGSAGAGPADAASAAAAHGGAGSVSMAAPAAALGALPPASGFGLEVPRPELIEGGLSIFRSMKRVTEDANPNGYSPGDVAQLLGDAAGIAVLASALAPAVGLISLAGGGAAVATDVKSPQEVFEGLRRNFGRMGYMQGVLDENVSHVDNQLGDLDISADALAGPPPPANPATLSAKDLKAARTHWAHRADAAFDALAAAQTELDDLDVRRSNLAHQIDSIGDLLVRIDQTGSVLLSDNLAATISYGRGWHFAGDSSKMATALRGSFARSRAAGAARRLRAAGTDAAVAADSAAGGSATITLGQWAAANRVADGRLAVLQALAGLERWRGFYDALAGSVRERIGSIRLVADQAIGARRDLAAEVQRRALQGPKK